MKLPLRKLWESRSPRDRALITVLAAIVAVVLYLWLVQSSYRARAQLGASLSVLRAQAIRLNTDAAEVERLRAVPAGSAPASPSNLRTLVQEQVDAAGLSRALVRIEAVDANQVQVVFGSVAFADWLNWVANLNAQRVRLDSSRIEALSTPGLVGVTATFVRARPQ